MTIGEKILMFRAKHNLTQKQMAGIIGVHPNMIQRYEQGVNNPHKIKVIQIEEKLKELEGK